MSPEACVNLLHESMEMFATLFSNWQFGVELVGKECLAAADAAPEPEAAQRRAPRALQQTQALRDQ